MMFHRTLVFLEAEAVLSILSRCQDGPWALAASELIDFELSKMTNLDKLRKVRALYSVAAGAKLRVTAEVGELALGLQRGGLRVIDSLHLALAEVWRQDVFLTTDDGFLKAAGRFDLAIVVANPVSWFMEVTSNEPKYV